MKKSVESVNVLYSKGKTKVNSGKMTLGSSRDFNSTLKNIVVGSAYTQGNVVSSQFDLNSNGPLLYDATEADNLTTINQFINIFQEYPTLVEYPYLTDVSVWDAETALANSQEFPIFKVPGKGKGKIEWFMGAPALSGDETEGNSAEIMEFYQPLGISDQPKSRTVNSFWFPFSGKNYSGTVVQLYADSSDDNRLKVVPYQMGRGIPQYIPGNPYFGGNPYGTPRWPDSGDPIVPQLSMGAVPGNNNVALGVVLDTERNLGLENVKVYNYEEPGTVLNLDWDNHTAPFVVGPNTVSGLSGLNSSNTTWAPWSSNYAYNNSDPLPLLTQGQTTLRVGAAYNIGMQAYFEPEIETGDDPLGAESTKYVSVPIVPLFQGEQLKIGSYVYASVMGHVLTYEQEGITPYPPAIQYNLGTSPTRDARIENPWYDWFDVTGGATGWTGTPQFRVDSIPDEGVAIIETKDGTTLPYLSQANQGSVIVHPVSTVDPADSTNGSGRMTLIGPADYTQTSDCQFTYIEKFPGAPERSQPVGSALECIDGTGQWTYSGGAIVTTTQSIVAPGTNFEDSFDVETYNKTKNDLLAEIEIVNGSLSIISAVGSGSTVSDYDNYPKGTVFTIIGDGSNSVVRRIIDSELMTVVVDSNDGSSVITFSIINAGTGYSDTTVATLFETRRLNIIGPKVDTVTDGSGGLSSVSIRDFGYGNETGDLIQVLPYDNFGAFTLDTTIDTENARSISGGYNYSTDLPESNVLRAISNTVADYTMDVQQVNGVVPDTVSDISPQYSVAVLEPDTFTLPDVSTGQILTLEQNIVTNNIITAQSSSGSPESAPGGGWDSYVYARDATFEQKAGENSVTDASSGYQIGATTASNGSETFDINIYSVDSNSAAITSISYYGPTEDGLPFDTPYIIDGGGGGTLELGSYTTSISAKGQAGFLTNSGSGYSTANGVVTLNLSSNPLFVFGEVKTTIPPAPPAATLQAAINSNTWTSITDSLTTGTDLRHIAWSSEIPMMVATGNSLGGPDFIYSADTITWTSQNSGNVIQGGGVIYVDDLDLFVNVGDNVPFVTGVATSPDGINWTTRSIDPSITNSDWRSVAWTGTHLVAIQNSGNNKVSRSTDGITWATNTCGGLTNAWESIVYSPTLSRLVAVSTDGTADRAMYSDDNGATWTAGTTPALATEQVFESIAWADSLSLFVAVASAGTESAATSVDGITWTTAGISGFSPIDWVSVAWAPEAEMFAAVAEGGGGGSRIRTSLDGLTWTSVSGISTLDFKSITWSNTLLDFFIISTNGSTARVTRSNSGYSVTPTNGAEIFEYNPTSALGEIEMPVRADGSVYIDLSRYEVGDTIQFNQDSDTLTGEFDIDSIDVAQSIMTLTQTDVGTGFVFPPNSDFAWFPTRNLTETATTVDIIAGGISGQVTSVNIASTGNRLRYGDYLLVLAGDENLIFQFTPEMNVPPQLQIPVNNRAATAAEWNAYRTVMKSSVNLLDSSLITNFSPMYPNYFNNSWYWYGDGGKDVIGT